MAVSINYLTNVISVEQSDLAFLQTNPATGLDIYTLNIVTFGKQLADIQDDADGAWASTAYEYTAEKDIGGVQLAPVLEIKAPYTVTFEDLPYGVNFTGGNTNLQDRTNVNQVSIRPNNSAGLTFSRAVNAQSFSGDAVHINLVTGNAGTIFPRGTPSDTVDNITDAKIIANEWGLRKFIIFTGDIGTITLDQNYSQWKFLGSVSNNNANIDFNGYSVDQCSFENCTIEGTATGKIQAKGCEIEDISGVTGEFINCGLDNAILPASTGVTSFINCYSEVPGTSTPYIDCGVGVVSSLQVRGYSGGLELRNVDQASESVSIDFNSGHLKLATTCTTGTIVVRGTGHITELGTIGSTINREGLVRGKLIEDQSILSAGRSIP